MGDGAYEVGTVLAGKYRVERVLGEGGMGIVLAARHLKLDEKVAVKVLQPHLARHPEVVARFLREAKAAARIRSDHIARVFDVDTFEDGAPYMVMEYLDGSDLGHLVKTRGPLPPEKAVDYLLQACEAIAEAHALGIVHRDLKPPNLYLTTKLDGSECIKVLDFGIAKIAEEDPSMQMTETNRQMGTPHYMAPEQLRSTRNADVRSDIWSLGAVLHELITGGPPYPADSIADLAVSMATKPTPSLRTLRPEVAQGLDQAFQRCLQNEPPARFATIAELAAALAPFGAEEARASARRIARMLGGGRASMASVSSEATPAPAGVASAPQTEGAWNQAVRPGRTRSRIVLYAAAAGTLVGVLGIVVAFKLSQPAPSAPGLAYSAGSASAGGAASATTPMDTATGIPVPASAVPEAVDAGAPAPAPATAAPAKPGRTANPKPPSTSTPRTKPNAPAPSLPDIH